MRPLVRYVLIGNQGGATFTLQKPPVYHLIRWNVIEAAGKILPHVASATVVGPGEVCLATLTFRSRDCRYTGPIPQTTLTALATPLLPWDYRGKDGNLSPFLRMPARWPQSEVHLKVSLKPGAKNRARKGQGEFPARRDQRRQNGGTSGGITGVGGIQRTPPARPHDAGRPVHRARRGLCWETGPRGQRARTSSSLDGEHRGFLSQSGTIREGKPLASTRDRNCLATRVEGACTRGISSCDTRHVLLAAPALMGDPQPHSA